VAAAVLEAGPVSTAELPDLVGHERKRVALAQERLQRRLVLTAAGRQERERGWPAVVLDVLPRRYSDRLGKLIVPEAARAELAATVMGSAGEVSAADISAVIGGTRKQAAAALDRLVDQGQAQRRDVGEFDLWTPA
jgi:hypothetical protein